MELKSRIDTEFSPFVSKPVRYLGNEYNAVLKDANQVELRVALCFPDIYEWGIQNIGFESAYYWLNARQNIWAERIYAPWTDAEEVMREKNIPLFSLESKTALQHYHLIVFYIPNHLTLINVINMLDLGQVPFHATDRSVPMPLVIGAGAVSRNPEPLARFLDALIIGNAADASSEIAELLMRCREKNWNKKELLKELAKLRGLYVPSFYEPSYNSFGELNALQKKDSVAPDRIEPRAVQRNSPNGIPLSPLVPLSDTVFNRDFGGEFSRAFASSPNQDHHKNSDGMVRNRISEPVPSQAADEVFTAVQKILDQAGYGKSAALLVRDEKLVQSGWRLSKEMALLNASQATATIAPVTLALNESSKLSDFGKKLVEIGFIFSPLAGSQRLRNKLNLNISEKDLLAALKFILEKGWQNIRFKFMIGLPTESEQDLREIANLMEKCTETAQPFSDVQISVSVQIFSPTPHTPFQWESAESMDTLSPKVALLTEQLQKLSLNFNIQDPFTSNLKTVFQRGGRELAAVVEYAWQSGVRFDGSEETSNKALWQQAFRQKGVTIDDYLAPISITVRLPWEHIDFGFSKAFLKEEKQLAYQGKLHPNNKSIVTIGDGFSEGEFSRLIRNFSSTDLLADSRENVNNSSTGSESSMEAIRYGRKSRKRQTPTPAIKKRIRVRYSKIGLSRFLSHLDIIQVFEKSCRIADLPLVYSQGLRQTPKMSYGPPLVTGIASTAEYLDMEIKLGREADLQYRLNKYLPEGLQILQFKGIYQKVPSLGAIINRSDYEIFLGDVIIPEEWILEWLDSNEVTTPRQHKEGIKEIDIRPFVEKFFLNKNKLLITIKTIEGRTAKITEILESLLASHGVDYRQFLVQRTAQYVVEENKILTPFDVLPS